MRHDGKRCTLNYGENVHFIFNFFPVKPCEGISLRIVLYYIISYYVIYGIRAEIWEPDPSKMPWATTEAAVE